VSILALLPAVRHNASIILAKFWIRMSTEQDFSGRARGGFARAEALTAKRRREIAKKGASARWGDGEPQILYATHGSADHPLKIGDIEIRCYVLEDETRVLAQRGIVGGIGMKYGSRAGGGDMLTGFLQGKGISPYVSQELLTRISNPIRFKVRRGGSIGYGYPATVLADICDAVLAARSAGVLQQQQIHIAERCEILVRGFARVGIIALVDEATGYQKDRARDALAKILEAFIDKELQPWVQTFPSEFYQEMFRLRGLEYPTATVKRPQYFGVLTNNVVYKRLAPGVLAELRRVTPKNEAGNRTHRFFQRLTQNTGYPKLKEHLGAVVAFMQTSTSWQDFMAKLDRFRPLYGDTLELDLGYPVADDNGKGL
jgi:hypothetical protein